MCTLVRLLSFGLQPAEGKVVNTSAGCSVPRAQPLGSSGGDDQGDPCWVGGVRISRSGGRPMEREMRRAVLRRERVESYSVRLPFRARKYPANP